MMLRDRVENGWLGTSGFTSTLVAVAGASGRDRAPTLLRLALWLRPRRS